MLVDHRAAAGTFPLLFHSLIEGPLMSTNTESNFQSSSSPPWVPAQSLWLPTRKHLNDKPSVHSNIANSPYPFHFYLYL